MIYFYLLYILVSLIEDSLKLATFYFRLDMGPVGIILAKISLDLVYSRILGETATHGTAHDMIRHRTRHRT